MKLNNKKLLKTLSATLILSSTILYAGNSIPSYLPFNTTAIYAESTATTGTVTNITSLNVRSGASTKYSSIGKVYKNNKVTIISTSSNGWYKIKFGTSYGYVSNLYITVDKTTSSAKDLNLTVSTTGKIVNISSLNVRKSNSTKSTKLGSLSKNDTVTVVGKTLNNWYKIKYKNDYGYVSGLYFKVSTTIKPNSKEAEAKFNQMKTLVKSNKSYLTKLVNKQNVLSSKFVPKNLVKVSVKSTKTIQVTKETSSALTKMFNDAKKDNVNLTLVSGYRSYSYQSQLFTNSIKVFGYDYANSYVARKGQSEHQTGLAVDISSKSVGYDLVHNYHQTTEGKWLIKNAHKYGFILRYQEDRVDHTGFNFEPWHFRYVGKEIATYMYENNLILEDLY